MLRFAVRQVLGAFANLREAANLLLVVLPRFPSQPHTRIRFSRNNATLPETANYFLQLSQRSSSQPHTHHSLGMVGLLISLLQKPKRCIKKSTASSFITYQESLCNSSPWIDGRRRPSKKPELPILFVGQWVFLPTGGLILYQGSRRHKIVGIVLHAHDQLRPRLWKIYCYELLRLANWMK